ncbi:amidase [Niallia sp. Krafla_26]|uniref:amidase n=1 Tax=Niallia sp. Krafla_26 TaxID=3064703 RepID=UPI003D174E2A
MKTNENNNNLLFKDLRTVSLAYREKQVSPVEVTQKLLDRIESKNPEINAYITICKEEAPIQAKQAEKEIMLGNFKSTLHGIPIAIKDLIYTENIITTMGSEIYQNFRPSYNATVVSKLKEAGAVILGKVNTHQFAYGTTGERSFYGPVKNVYNPSKISGGSSSGSAVAVASSLCFAALGTDTGGSVRIPSSFNGIVGLKPTYGRVSKHGVYPLSWTMDTVGPMTKTVEDNAIMMNTLSGFDDLDPHSQYTDKIDFTANLEKGIEGLNIGIPDTPFFQAEDEEINFHYEKSIQTFQRLRAHIKRIEIPDMNPILEAFRITLKSEAYAVHKENLQKFPEEWDDEVKTRLLTGSDIHAVQYIEAQKVKQQAMKDFRKVLSKVDILLTPTVPILPTDIGQREVSRNGSILHISLVLNSFTGPFNLLGLPGLSIPCGISKSGLPVGLQLIGKWFDESTLYRFASAFEKKYNFLPL